MFILMLNSVVRGAYRLSALCLLMLAILGTTGLAWAQDRAVGFTPVPKTAVESRLKRYKGSDNKREGALKQMFVEAGCVEPHISEQIVKGSKLPNVICVLPGSSQRVVIVGAHFDHVSAGDGVVDNWSGASLLPSLYEALKAEPHQHTYIFVGFTDEERGEVGSRYYVRQMTSEEVNLTDAMVNIDTLGLAPTEIWLSHADRRLASTAADVAGRMNLPLTGVSVDQIGTTDSEQFAARKIPSVTLHSLTQAAVDAGILHSSKDRITEMRLGDYYDSYRLLCGYLSALDLEVAGRR